MKIVDLEFLKPSLVPVQPVPRGTSQVVDGILLKNTLETSMPDIDYDVSSPMELKEELVKEWGEDKVAPISNWNTLQLRSLIKDISKFYNIPFQEVNKVTGKMLFEATPLAKKKHGITAGVYNPTFEEVMEFSTSLQEFLKKYPHVKTHVEALYGSIRSCSRHAGGVVVSENLDSCMPLINSKGVRQTPWSEGQNVRHLEPMGFIKFDILGLASLRMIEGAIRHILIRHEGIKDPTFEDVRRFYEENLSPDNNKLDDQSVFENVFHAGKWAGIFQCLDGKTKILMSDLSEKNLEDIVPGESVISYNEERCEFEPMDVLNFFEQGEREVYKITLENGKEIEATLDHKFLTKNRGWVMLKELTEDDELLSYE